MSLIYNEVAEYIMFSSGLSNEKVIEKLNNLELIFRKNKGISDIISALNKSKSPKIGRCQTEFEVDMFSLYLEKDILKRKRLYKVGDRVRIVEVPPKNSNLNFFKDYKNTPRGKYLGTVMTIAKVEETFYVMKEDDGYYAWSLDFIETKI